MKQGRHKIAQNPLLLFSMLLILISVLQFFDQQVTAIDELHTFYGVHIHNTWAENQDAQQISLAAPINAEVVRLGVSWWLLEPTPGNWDTTWYIPALAERIAALQAKGIQPLLMFGHVPCWASTEQPAPDCNEPTEPNHNLWCPPTNPNDYANALAYLMNTFGDSVQLWEVWNEPNLPQFWCNQAPTAQAYARLLQAAYVQVKSIDPNSIVLGGALAGADSEYLQAMYAANADDYYDALSVHPYNGRNTPPSSCPDPFNTRWEFECGINAIRKTMTDHDDFKPIWLTEFGWCITEGNDCAPDEAIQAAFLEEALTIIDEQDFIAGAIWYSLADCSLPNSFCTGDYGLFRGDLSPKLAAETYKIEVGRRQQEWLKYRIMLPMLIK